MSVFRFRKPAHCAQLSDSSFKAQILKKLERNNSNAQVEKISLEREKKLIFLV